MSDPGIPDDLGNAINAEEFARRAILRHFRAMVSHIDGIIENTDPEPIHQFRVAARRLRAVAGTFAAIFPADETQNLLAAIKDLAALAGKARDLDVQIAFLRDYLNEFAPSEANSVQGYIDEQCSERKALQSVIVAVLANLRTSGFVKAFIDHFDKMNIATTLSALSRLRSLEPAPP